ncbi:LysR family transcriptional regulator [Magnetospirillum molischianum]|nr:LysR family transcriptional regulator [Magnetospirillum molischianum]
MSSFRLHDWNDIRLIIACASRGSFAGAASELGLDQTTVSRRISAIETAIGRPLFNRRRSGASPTPAGIALLERALRVQAAAAEFEGALHGLSTFPSPKVTVSASEGLLTYTLIPALLGHKKAELPLDPSMIRSDLPDLAFTTASDKADISVIATSPGDLPRLKGAVRVRRVGTMHFVPVASRTFLNRLPPLQNFDDLIEHPLLDIGIYQAIRGLDGWNSLISLRKQRGETVLVAPTTPKLHQPLLSGKGVSLLPNYSTLYEPKLVRLDLPSPPMGVSLWLVSHEDTLREPAVRELYDLMATMFLASSWYREN